MNWKNWPYWLKGGISTALLLSLIWAIIVIFDAEVPSFLLFCLNPLILIKAIYSFLVKTVSFSAAEKIILVISILFYFIIGSLIGYIVGEIKSKNR